MIAKYDQTSFYGLGELLLGAMVQYSATAINWPIVFGSVTSVIGDILTMASLVLHVRVVFAPAPRTQKYVTFALAMIASVVPACDLAWNVFYQEAVWANQLSGNTPPYYRLYVFDYATCTAIVGIACAVLVGKLYLAIRWCHIAGIRKFGVLHVLLITFGQCLVIPYIEPLFG